MSIRPRLNGYRCALAVALSYACVAILPGFSVPSSFGQEQVQGEIRAYALRHRNADDLAPQLRNMLSGLAGNANVSVDRENNRLLVQGLAQSQQLALQVIQALDKPVDPPKSPAPLPNAANSSVVKSYRVSGDLDRIANQLRTRYPNGSGVRIATDPRTQQLLVIAPPALQQRIAQELSGQAPQPAATAPVRQPALPARPVVPNAAAPVRATSYQLMHTSWREFEGGLQQLLGARIRTSTARNGELLMVHLVTVNGLQPVLQ
ncbi:MAG: secretin N-terminal domain-containing protein, partial [Pirellulaceae bacterium]|nr:secretin N-terminal domain-containing protein [Pirellulaceae bacterium]